MSKGDTARLRLATLSRNEPYPLKWEPDADSRARMADSVGARSLRKLRLEGELIPEGRADWRLKATLGVTAVQDCVVTTEPVTTRVDAPLVREFRADIPPDSAGETEMAADGDSIEPLPETLDLAELVVEALLLELPEFPRADGAELGAVRAAPPGAASLDEEREKPFADLAAFRARMEGDD